MEKALRTIFNIKKAITYCCPKSVDLVTLSSIKALKNSLPLEICYQKCKKN